MIHTLRACLRRAYARQIPNLRLQTFREYSTIFFHIASVSLNVFARSYEICHRKTLLKHALNKKCALRGFYPKPSGHTLPELLLYIGIIAVVLLAATNVIFTVLEGKQKLQAMEDVNQNSRFALEKIAQAVRNAQSVTIPSAGSTSTILTIQTSSTTTTPTSFFLSGGVLQIKEGASPTTSLMADEVTVNSLLFQNAGGTSTPASIRIVFSVSSTNPLQDPNLSYGKTFYASANVRK